MNFLDRVAVAGTRRTADGYLIADAKAVRTGIQTYLGSEVGRPELHVVRVYRAEDEVRSADSLRSFSHAPVTVDHPSEPVTAENWKDLAVGEVSTAATWDGNRISLPLILKDAKAIEAVTGGKRELSAGYTCDIDFTPGTTPDGQAYDAAQRNIRANHVAIVDRGRAGTECRIGDTGRHTWGTSPITLDNNPEKAVMTDAIRTVVVDGLSVSSTDQGVQAINKLTKDRETAQAALADAQKALTVAIAAKDEEIGKLKVELQQAKDAAPKPEQLDKLVADRAALVTTVKAIDNRIVVDGKTDADLRKAAVAARLGDEMVKDASEAEIAGMFKAVAKDAAKPQLDAAARVIAGGLRTSDAHVSLDDAERAAHAAYEERLRGAWSSEQQKGNA